MMSELTGGPSSADALARGRELFRRRSWAAARDLLMEVDRSDGLGPADVELLARASTLAGLGQEAVAALVRAHHAYLDGGDCESAARCAFWAGMDLRFRGEAAQGSAWLGRVRRVLEDHRLESVQTGYLCIPTALEHLMSGDAQRAFDAFTSAVEYGHRFGDRDLMALGRMGQGQALVARGEPGAGIDLLDEVMLAVLADEVSELPSGIIYCAVIEACHDVFDLRRAQEWTTALGRWCDSQPELVPFTGLCQVHRAELAVLHGEWDQALAVARRAADRYLTEGHPAIGAALYEQGEIHRLRGDLVTAEALYEQANAHGREPQPGLALLRLAEGRVGAAAAGLHRCVVASAGTPLRSRLLPAYVEVLLAAGDAEGAREAADELLDACAANPSAWLSAVAQTADGAVRLAEDDPGGALAQLRASLTGWQQLRVPYEVARVRTMLAQVCRSLGDDDGARMEQEAAHRLLSQLGAATGSFPIGSAAPHPPAPLTAREVEVLRLVATGLSNRAVASRLVLSEKTVARHLSNIFTKLGLGTRSAATAYAYEHHLVELLQPDVTQPRGTAPGQ